MGKELNACTVEARLVLKTSFKTNYFCLRDNVDTAHVVYALLKIEVVDTRNLEKIKSRRIIIR